MKSFWMVTFFFFGVFGFLMAETISPQKAVLDADGKTAWYDGRDLPLEGKAFSDTLSFYDRLPARAQGRVTQGVWELSHDSAGMVFRFQTDAPSIRIRWTLMNRELQIYHMPATGMSGVDVYALDARGWRFLNGGHAVSISNDWPIACTAGKPLLIHLPLYNRVRSFSIGIPKTCSIQTLPPRKSGVTKPVVFYGSSITQGGCASRPGMAFTAIVGRTLDIPIVNLGFSGSGRMELEMCDYISEIDASVYVLDCKGNMNEQLSAERTERFIRELHKRRPGVPILLADVWMYHSLKQFAIYEKLKAEDPVFWKNLSYLTNTGMDDAEGSVDDCHLSDLGMTYHAKKYCEALAPLLAK